MSDELSKTSKERNPVTPPTAEKDDPPTMTLPSVAAVARDGKGEDESTDDNPPTLLSVPAVTRAALEDGEDEDEDESAADKPKHVNQPAGNDEHQPTPQSAPPSVPASPRMFGDLGVCCSICSLKVTLRLLLAHHKDAKALSCYPISITC